MPLVPEDADVVQDDVEGAAPQPVVIHEPVMAREIGEMLVVNPDGVYVDGTLGTGGHAEWLLRLLGNHGRLVGVDRDTDALEIAGTRLAPWGERCQRVHGNFSDLTTIAARLNLTSVDGILLDLGVSSLQLDRGSRGFSFQRDAPLDMRMDRSRGETAEAVIRRVDEESLIQILRTLGEEPSSRAIARAIIRQRNDVVGMTTGWLADLVARVSGNRRYGKIHPATHTFQALRMVVNRELECLKDGLEAGVMLVRPGGRMAVLTYHSLEDRLVKHFFKEHEGAWESLPAGGRRLIVTLPQVRWINKKPLTASDDEIRRNPRARSAKLRVVERTE